VKQQSCRGNAIENFLVSVATMHVLVLEMHKELKPRYNGLLMMAALPRNYKIFASAWDMFEARPSMDTEIESLGTRQN